MPSIDYDRERCFSNISPQCKKKGEVIVSQEQHSEPQTTPTELTPTTKNHPPIQAKLVREFRDNSPEI